MISWLRLLSSESASDHARHARSHGAWPTFDALNAQAVVLASSRALPSLPDADRVPRPRHSPAVPSALTASTALNRALGAAMVAPTEPSRAFPRLLLIVGTLVFIHAAYSVHEGTRGHLASSLNESSSRTTAAQRQGVQPSAVGGASTLDLLALTAFRPRSSLPSPSCSSCWASPAARRRSSPYLGLTRCGRGA